jgi:glycosidase
MIMNPNRKYDDQNGLRNNPNYDVGKPTAGARRLQKLILLFQMTYVGAPMIYYGDEGGMWGADDPDDRKPMIWEDLTYENERSHPIPGKTRTDDEVKFDKDLFNYYKKLVQVRKDLPALRRGDFTTLLVDDARSVFAFKRSSGDSEALVLINNGDAVRTIDLSVPGTWLYRNALTSKTIQVHDSLRQEIEAKSGVILLKIR